jgi:hypothetical protein
LFRRSKSESPAEPTTVVAKPGGKGRPTPTRKEAEAAAKARAKAVAGRAGSGSTRAARAESSRQVREAMRKGDERYYPPRDRGPQRRFVRDFVDSRFSPIELVIPLLLVTMVLGYSGNARLASIGNTVLLVALLLVAMDMVLLRFRLHRELVRRFPGQSYKGLTQYALTRGVQMKFMRLPKSKVRIGQRLPDDYR